MAALLLGLVLPFAASSAAQEPVQPREIYDSLFSAFNGGRTLMGRDNLTGAIVWGESHVLNSLIDMYRATGDERYLRTFVEHGDSVLAQRDDLVGRTGWDRRPQLGWSTAGGYTFGRSVILPDASGHPSLEVRGVHWADNGETRVAIRGGSGDSYSLEVVHMPGDDEYRRVWDDLTQETVEDRVNQGLTLQSYVMARRVGDRPPAETPTPVQFTPQPVALTVFHNGFILTPFARFVELVTQERLSAFEGPSARYLAAAEGAWSQADEHWEDHADFGFYRIRPNVPFWASGLAAPVNVQSSHGLLSLHLAQATGEYRYRARTRQILELLRRLTRQAERGAHTIHYLFGEAYTGWGPPSGLPQPFGNVYHRYSGRTAIEDTGHGARSALLVHQAARYGLLDPEYLEGWVETAGALLPPDVVALGGMAERLPRTDGAGTDVRGTHDIIAPTWALLGTSGDEALFYRALQIYRNRFATRERSAAVLLGWAQLTWLASEFGSDVN